MNARPARYPVGDQARRGALAKVHLARKELGLEEVDYRAILERITGRTSAADCSMIDLGRVLDEFRAKGWQTKPAARPARKAAPASSPVARKARALWISLWHLGEVRDPSERALEAFGRRQLGVDRLQWADQSQGYRLIEALKAMAERAGWSQDLAGVPGRLQVAMLQSRLVARQRERLAELTGDAAVDLVEPGALGELIRARLAEAAG